jgi:tetratricopeptide (TPR) repeat protein
MSYTRKVLFAIAPTVAAFAWLSVVPCILAEPAHQHGQPQQRSHVKSPCTAPSDGAEKARDVLNAASDHSLRFTAPPQWDLLSEIAVAWSRAGDAARSGEIFKSALKTASGITDAGERYCAFSGIAEYQAMLGEVRAAIRTSQLLASSQSRASILSMIATTVSDAGGMQEALTAAKLIPEECRMERSAAIGSVASCMARKGKWSQAIAVLDGVNVDMAHADKLRLSQKAGATLTPSEETSVAEAACKAVALLDVAQSYALAGHFVEATKVAESIGFALFRDRAMRNIASIAANARNLEVARRLASLIRDEQQKGLALGDVAAAEAAKGLLDDSLKTVRSIRESRDKADALIHVAAALAQSGDHERAEKVLLTVEKEELESAERMADEVGIAKTFAQHGAFASAENLAQRLPSQTSRARIMVAIGRAHTEKGNTAEAQKSFRRGYESALRIGDPYEKTYVLCEIATSQVAAKEFGAAASVLKDAAQIARTIPVGGGTNVIALRDVAVAQANSRDVPAAKATFHVALNAAKAYPDEEYVARLCQDVMAAQVQSGGVAEALEAARSLEPGVVKCRSLLGIALGLLPTRQ